MPPDSATAERAPLTILSDDEILFRDAVAAMAEEMVRPRVQDMERAGKIDPELTQAFADMGLMGIEIPEELRRRRRHASSWPSSPSRSWHRSTPPPPSTSTSRTRWSTTASAAGAPTSSKRATCRGSPRGTLGAYALSEAGQRLRRLRAAPPGRADGDDWVLNGRKLWITNGAEAGLFLVFANVDPAKPATRASPPSSSSATSPASPSARRKTSSASAPRAPAS